jgi:hypothetical protein
MIKLSRILFIFFHAIVCFVTSPLSIGQAEVTLTAGNGSGVVGSSENTLVISLDNPTDKIKGINFTVCDEGNYLSCTRVEPTERYPDASGPDVIILENGCTRVSFYFLEAQNIIEEGNGPIFNLFCNISPLGPSGECRDVYLENVVMADGNVELDYTIVTGEFCYLSCISNSDCSDGAFCNGAEACVSNNCQPGVPPCEVPLLCDEDGNTCVECFEDADCDDGVFCNGAETCDTERSCQSGSDPCGDDGEFCNGIESCDVDADACVSSGNPCKEDENCIEGNDICEPSIAIGTKFSGCGFPVFLWFGAIEIQGTGTNFTSLSPVLYDSPLVIKLPKLLDASTQTITQIVFLMPSILFPEWNYPAAVMVTVDGLSDTFEIPPCR